MSASKKKRKKPVRKARGSRRARPRRGSPSKAKAKARKKAGRKADPRAKSARKRAAKNPVRNAASQRSSRERAKKQRRAEQLKRKTARERELAARKREREREAAARERARAKKERDREAALAKKEREKKAALAKKEREKEAALAKKERARREKEKAREKAQRLAERARAKREAEARRAALKKEREAERRRVIEEREAAKEAARRAREEERARREAEREAYRKAKEAERERLRAEREAARRLREGKVARATRAAQRVDGLRVSTSRVYDPSSIPNQSGTTRRPEGGQVKLVGVRAIEPSSVTGSPRPQPSPARPTPPAPPPPTTEARYQRILERLVASSESLRKEYEDTLEMSWIHHDSALEGVVYTFAELQAAMDPSPSPLPDSSLQPVCEEIRRHRQAIAYVRDLGERKRVPLNVDVVKKLYVMLHPEEGDVKSVKYRKDIPQHRLYFHEYAPPDKIAYRVRQIMDWLNGPEAKKMKHPLRVAARVHYDLVRVFPFPQDSGKVSRLLMNIVLLRGGYPPAIIHSTERQRYYEALKGQLPVIIQLVNESILNALASIEKRLDDEDRGAS